MLQPTPERLLFQSCFFYILIQIRQSILNHHYIFCYEKASLLAVASINAVFPTILIVVMLTLCLYGNTGYAQKTAPPAALAVKKAQPPVTYTIIDGANGTFGYNVYVDGRLKLYQPSIPAMPGNEGFKTKAAAEQVAQPAIKKMKRGESLPTISPKN